jgi:hypothetical protein
MMGSSGTTTTVVVGVEGVPLTRVGVGVEGLPVFQRISLVLILIESQV